VKHPLINNDSKHYDAKGTPAILELEKKLSVAAMMGAVEFNLFKYEYRKEHKGQRGSDEKKIATYQAYGDVLKDLVHKGHAKLTVNHAYHIEGISYE